jgi:phosphohistidine phosphatase SixA
VGSVLLVGHSSGIEALALLLARGGARRDELSEKFPTGAPRRSSSAAAGAR